MAQGTTKGVPIDIDPTLAADSDLLVPSQKAIKTYVDTNFLNPSDLSATTPLTYSSSTGVFTINQASSLSNGYLTSTDWSTFNGKGSGTVTSVAALTLGTSGTDLGSSVATGTTTPVITLNVPDASATARGVVNTTTQSFIGAKTFINDLIVNNITIGLGSGAVPYNTVVGLNSLFNNTSGNFNTALGCTTLTSNTTGDNNIAVGYNALYTNTTGGLNIAIGVNSITNNTIGNANVAIGNDALSSSVSGDYNVAIGTSALSNNISGVGNVALGVNSLQSNTTGLYNLAIGIYAGASITTGSSNNIIGSGANSDPLDNAFDQNNTLLISKSDNNYGVGLPHIWAPDTCNIRGGTNFNVIKINSANYSGMFVEYVIEDSFGNSRGGYIKAIWNNDRSIIKYTEDATDDIGLTSDYIFSVIDDTVNSCISLRLYNNGINDLSCNLTSRLIARMFV
jgi:hypothetical protein